MQDYRIGWLEYIEIVFIGKVLGSMVLLIMIKYGEFINHNQEIGSIRYIQRNRAHKICTMLKTLEVIGLINLIGT